MLDNHTHIETSWIISNYWIHVLLRMGTGWHYKTNQVFIYLYRTNISRQACTVCTIMCQAQLHEQTGLASIICVTAHPYQDWHGNNQPQTISTKISQKLQNNNPLHQSLLSPARSYNVVYFKVGREKWRLFDLLYSRSIKYLNLVAVIK